MTRPDVDATATVHPTVHVGPDCRVGPGSVLASGAFLQAGVELGREVLVGPNAAFIDRSFEATNPRGHLVSGGIVVHDHAAIGANATVLSGVTVHQRAVVGAGAVVTRDVPPHAVVVGNPARIVGYATSPNSLATEQVIASNLDDDELPLRIGRIVLQALPSVVDLRGALSHAEFPKELPFAPTRCFFVYDVPNREVRGEHAHLELEELLICVTGEVAVAVDDGRERGEIVLDRPDVALHLPPMVWSRQYRYSPDAVLVVLASDPYDAGDYVRDYEDFRARLASRAEPGA